MLLHLSDAFVYGMYGKGLCFGMAVAYGLATMRDWAASELDPSLGKDATLKEVLDSGALGEEGPDAPESLSAKRRKKKGE